MFRNLYGFFIVQVTELLMLDTEPLLLDMELLIPVTPVLTADTPPLSPDTPGAGGQWVSLRTRSLSTTL